MGPGMDEAPLHKLITMLGATIVAERKAVALKRQNAAALSFLLGSDGMYPLVFALP